MRSDDLFGYFQILRAGFNAVKEFLPKKERYDPPPPTPPDFTEETNRLRRDLLAINGAEAPVVAPVLEKPTPSPAAGILMRTGVDSVRLGWQDGLTRAELWLLEGHLKNNCLGCGGDVECCYKHTTNLGDATGETRSMTTDPLYQKTVELARRILPLVHPDDVKTGLYKDRYPDLVIEVSQIRTEFDNRMMAQKTSPATLEQAKQEVAALAMEEVERRWEENPGPAAKEPWQMTYEELARNTAGIAPEVQRTKIGQMVWQDLKESDWQPHLEEYQPGARIPTFRLSQAHRKSIKQAFSEGKPVPPEVLDDYPDLFDEELVVESTAAG